nr:MAG TPA: hypothetical protein [Caudoviricetes sp.]
MFLTIVLGGNPQFGADIFPPHLRAIVLLRVASSLGNIQFGQHITFCYGSL